MSNIPHIPNKVLLVLVFATLIGLKEDLFKFIIDHYIYVIVLFMIYNIILIKYNKKE